MPQPDTQQAHGASARLRLFVSLAAGVPVALVVAVFATWQAGLLAGWIVAGAVFVTWMWITIWPMGSARTASHANREDAGRPAADTAVLIAAVASLIAVGLVLTADASDIGGQAAQAAVSLVSVVVSWTSVHTIFTTRYAELYYGGNPRGIDFNDPTPPRYTDFAYLAFTIGMTFQVSDTLLKSSPVRATALRHALLSYLFGVGIIAAMINLVAGLGK
jgi:uncharacterized membrane protein